MNTRTRTHLHRGTYSGAVVIGDYTMPSTTHVDQTVPAMDIETFLAAAAIPVGRSNASAIALDGTMSFDTYLSAILSDVGRGKTVEINSSTVLKVRPGRTSQANPVEHTEPVNVAKTLRERLVSYESLRRLGRMSEAERVMATPFRLTTLEAPNGKYGGTYSVTPLDPAITGTDWLARIESGASLPGKADERREALEALFPALVGIGREAAEAIAAVPNQKADTVSVIRHLYPVVASDGVQVAESDNEDNDS